MAAVPLAASKPAAPPAVKTRARRSLPVWVQLLLLSAVAGFLFFVYQAMETNEVGLFKQSGADDSTSKWTSCSLPKSLPSLSYSDSASASLCWFSSRGLLPEIFIYSYKDWNSQILHCFLCYIYFSLRWTGLEEWNLVLILKITFLAFCMFVLFCVFLLILQINSGAVHKWKSNWVEVLKDLAKNTFVCKLHLVSTCDNIFAFIFTCSSLKVPYPSYRWCSIYVPVVEIQIFSINCFAMYCGR